MRVMTSERIYLCRGACTQYLSNALLNVYIRRSGKCVNSKKNILYSSIWKINSIFVLLTAKWLNGVSWHYALCVYTSIYGINCEAEKQKKHCKLCIFI